MQNRVLLIDDEHIVLAAVRDYLRASLNCEIHCAADREEADALMEAYEYSLAITDLAFSSYSLEGLQIVDDLAHLQSRPRIVVFTGCINQEVEAAARARGADAVLPKSGSMSALTATARQLMSSAEKAPSGNLSPSTTLMQSLLSDRGVRPFVQPLLEVTPAQAKVFGVEFLSRGPVGTPFERADALFAYARNKRTEDVLDAHCAQRAIDAAAGLPPHMRLNINFHASTLGRNPEIAHWLSDLAARRGLDPARITVEIIEHAPTWNKPDLLTSLKNLRGAGIQIALDDVGLGQSNYQMILDVRPECFKIDRYIIARCSHDPDRRAIIASIVALARQFGSRVIAEGIEEPEDLATLQDLGINLMQGHLFCRALPIDQFLQWVRSNQETESRRMVN